MANIVLEFPYEKIAILGNLNTIISVKPIQHRSIAFRRDWEIYEYLTKQELLQIDVERDEGDLATEMERIPVVFGDPPKGRHPMVHDLATIMKAIAVVVEDPSEGRS